MRSRQLFPYQQTSPNKAVEDAKLGSSSDPFPRIFRANQAHSETTPHDASVEPNE